MGAAAWPVARREGRKVGCAGAHSYRDHGEWSVVAWGAGADACEHQASIPRGECRRVLRFFFVVQSSAGDGLPPLRPPPLYRILLCLSANPPSSRSPREMG